MASLTEFKEEKKPATFTALMAELQPQFKASLPAHLKANSERYMRLALTEYRRNPALSKCDPYSVLGAAMVATGLGLEIGPLGRAYLIPYGNQCQFVPGWKGLVELASRSGRSSVWTGVLYAGQKHEYEQGDSPRLKVLEDSDEDDPAKIEYTYAIGRIRGAEWPVIERWSVAKIKKHRDRYNKVGARHYSFDNFEMYARKVPLLQVLKYLPASPELEAAMMLDIAAERGKTMTVDSAAQAIDGTFTVDDSPAPPAPSQNTEAGLASGPSAAGSGGLTPEDAFALADDACKKKDWDTARDLMRSCNEKDRKIIASKLPKEQQ